MGESMALWRGGDAVVYPGDDELMQAYVAGDGGAFGALFLRHSASVYNFARAMLGSDAPAEDALQETFLAVARSAHVYEPRRRFRTWLMRIARNKCLNAMEHCRRQRRQVASLTVEELDPPDAGPDAPSALVARERMAALRQAVERLPERQREAIVLFAYEDMSYREIARVLDVSVGNVKTLIHRGRARLARLYDLGEEADDAV